MEGLAPLHRLCLQVQNSIECGEPIVLSLKKAIPLVDQLTREQLVRVIFSYENEGRPTVSLDKSSSQLRRALFATICQGLCGEPILNRLQALEREIKSVSEDEIERFIAGLPLRALLPVLLLQFPAFLILLFGPLLQSLKEGLL